MQGVKGLLAGQFVVLQALLCLPDGTGDFGLGEGLDGTSETLRDADTVADEGFHLL